MSLDDYRKAQERFYREIDALAEEKQADAWERRLMAIVQRTERTEHRLTRSNVLKVRDQLIRDAKRLRPDLSEVDAAAIVDRVIGL